MLTAAPSETSFYIRDVVVESEMIGSSGDLECDILSYGTKMSSYCIVSRVYVAELLLLHNA